MRALKHTNVQSIILGGTVEMRYKPERALTHSLAKTIHKQCAAVEHPLPVPGKNCAEIPQIGVPTLWTEGKAICGFIVKVRFHTALRRRKDLFM